MSLSARERRTLREVERHLAGSGPLAGGLGRLAAMLVSLLAGISTVSAGLVPGVPGRVVGGCRLAQLGPVATGRLAGPWRPVARRCPLACGSVTGLGSRASG